MTSYAIQWGDRFLAATSAHRGSAAGCCRIVGSESDALRFTTREDAQRVLDAELSYPRDDVRVVALSLQVSRKQIEDGSITETEPHHYVTEASTLGLPPGSYPERLETDLGNGLPLLRVRRSADRAWLYRQDLGCVDLVVFDD